MAQFQCGSCGYDAHFVEFKAGTHCESDEETGEEIEVDDLACPECDSEHCFEL